MAEKDMTEKTLEAYNDVFADIVNVLLFKGKQIIKPESLTDAGSLSTYKIDGKLHEQERDVAKFCKQGNIRIALYGLENQTKVDKDMPFRVIGYDGAVYRNQLNEGKNRYPVITLVLYFGEGHWTAPKRLKECLNIPDELKKYVNDYKVHVFEIPYLSRRQVNMFKSDFKIVADYFVQERKTQNYKPSKDKIKHVDEILKLLRVLKDDPRYELSAEEIKEVKKGEKRMDKILDKLLAKGEARGRAEGKAEGIAEGEARGYNSVAENMIRENMSAKLISKLTNLSMSKLKEISNQIGVALVM